MPGASGVCKNVQCLNPRTGKRRQAQSGNEGYCATCARTFLPDVAAKARAIHSQRRRRCAQCAAVEGKIRDEETGLLYCKLCYRKRKFGQCSYCCAESDDVTEGPCAHKLECLKRVRMCPRCVGVHGKVICDECWVRDWRSSCLSCARPLPTIQSWPLRYCHTCYRAVFRTGETEEQEDGVHGCFYCRSTRGDIATLACGHTEACEGQVNVCQRCVALHQKVVCSWCWVRCWQSKCFRCASATPQYLQNGVDY